MARSKRTEFPVPKIRGLLELFAIFHGQDDRPDVTGHFFSDEQKAWRYGETMRVAPVKVIVTLAEEMPRRLRRVA